MYDVIVYFLGINVGLFFDKALRKYIVNKMAVAMRACVLEIDLRHRLTHMKGQGRVSNQGVGKLHARP